MHHTQIGNILQEMGLLGEAQLVAALHAQKASHLKLGEILVKLNFVTEEELARAIAKQYDLEYIELNHYLPDPDLLTLIDVDTASLNTLLPILEENDVLYVAITKPDEDMKSYLEEITDKKIVFKISTTRDIEKSIHTFYDQSGKSVETCIENIIVESVDENEVDIITLADLLLDDAINEQATDIHIVPEVVTSHIFYRIDGVLHHYYSLPYKYHRILSTRLKVLSKLDISNNIMTQTGEFEHVYVTTQYNIRISIIPTVKGEKLALRLHPENFTLYNLTSLGFDSDLIEKLEAHINNYTGMLLIIGPSGSGKSSTLYSLLRKINILERNVISIEEPVEFQLPFINHIEVNPKRGLTYAEAIRNVARQDPDVIVVGEILDKETAKLALQASMGGHLVLSTIFGKNPSSVITRLIGFKVDRYAITDGLTAILSQRLVRRLCTKCKELVQISKSELLSEFKTCTLDNRPENVFEIYRAKGCKYCKNTGYKGRVALAEFLEIDNNLRKLIESNDISLNLEKYIKEHCIKTLQDDALQKLLEGCIDMEEVKRI